MEFNECVKTRRSIRKYNNQEVSLDLVKKIIETTLSAPSWMHTQVTRYYVIIDPIKKKKIADSMPSFNQAACHSAPCLIVSTILKNRSGYNRDGSYTTNKGSGWQMYDCGISNYLLTLAAHDIGLGTVIIGIYDQKIIEQVIEIPDTEELGAVITLGYYDGEGTKPKERAVESIFTVR
jgi:Nitroreductase